MDMSPTTPSIGQQRFIFPPQPSISPSLHLPKLITSFQNTASNARNLRKMSLQFQLPTPSPLTLSQTPVTAISRRNSVQTHRRTGAIDDGANPPPFDGELPPLSPSAQRKVPRLRRQEAMQGLEHMQDIDSPIIEQVVRLPLRTRQNTSPTDSEHIEDVELGEIADIASTYRRILPKPQHGQKIDTTTPRGQSRSPIKKHRHRRANSRSLIVVARKQTSEESYLDRTISHLGTQLVPLISVKTGQPHPDFPRSLLQYQLLTHDQLDALARHYHQTIDAGRERWDYPCPIGWGKVWCGSTPMPRIGIEAEERRYLVDLITKRRRFGRFIGLKVDDSPVRESAAQEESLVQRMEREWRNALRRADNEQKMREKMWGRRGF